MRLPVIRVEPGGAEQVAAMKDHAYVGLFGHAVALVPETHERLCAFRDMRPAFPRIRFRPRDFIQGLEQAGIDETRNLEAVEFGEIGPLTGGKIERQLLRHLLRATGEFAQFDCHITSLRLRHGNISGNHDLLEPARLGPVHAAFDAAAGDRHFDRRGLCRRTRRQAE
jgi:hypothetical protein